MIEVVKSTDRGKTLMGWLESYHSFSFNRHYDPDNVQFGPLRVLNDDKVQPDAGFSMHPHDNMEIVTIIIKGALEHQDSMGTKEVIRENEVQRMTAGSGIMHSEYNPSNTELVHLLQIWFIPNKRSLTPSYDQKKFSPELRKNKWLKIVDGENINGIISINQDAKIFLSDLQKGNELSYPASNGRGLYLYLIDGNIKINDMLLNTGDAVKISDEEELRVSAQQDSNLVLFDVNLYYNS